MYRKEKTEVLGEKLSQFHFVTPTDSRSNSGLRGERPETNRLSHGTATVKTTVPYTTYTVQFGPHREQCVLPMEKPVNGSYMGKITADYCNNYTTCSDNATFSVLGTWWCI